MTVSEGAFLFVGGKIEGPSGGNVEIRTPVGTLGVRGTTFWGGAIDGGYGVLVLSGEVSVTTRRGRVVLKEGQGTMVFSGRGLPALRRGQLIAPSEPCRQSRSIQAYAPHRPLWLLGSCRDRSSGAVRL